MEKHGLAIFGVCLALGIIIGTAIFVTGIKEVVPSNQVVKVRGVAEQFIETDRVDWKISISYSHKELAAAYAKVDMAVKKVKTFLVKNQVPEQAVKLVGYDQNRRTQMITLDEFGNQKEEFIGYEVSCSVFLEAFEDLNLVEKLKKEFALVIQKQGIAAVAHSPYFYYHKKVSDIKPALLEKAAKNAFERATIVAKNSGAKIGKLKAARQGNFEGMGEDGLVGGYNRKQRISAVVTVDYSLK
ncbi:SIMPL domain-containing protein [bacterium]|nr:SIMPL domain-containing protein [bacterium]